MFLLINPLRYLYNVYDDTTPGRQTGLARLLGWEEPGKARMGRTGQEGEQASGGGGLLWAKETKGSLESRKGFVQVGSLAGAGREGRWVERECVIGQEGGGRGRTTKTRENGRRGREEKRGLGIVIVKNDKEIHVEELSSGRQRGQGLRERGERWMMHLQGDARERGPRVTEGKSKSE